MCTQHVLDIGECLHWWGHLGWRWHGPTSQWGLLSCRAGPRVAAPVGVLGCILMSLPGLGGSRGTLSCLGLATAVTLSLDRTTTLAGFAGFGAGAMARGCLGRKWGSWLAVPLSIPASLDRSFQGGCMFGFTQASSTANVSHLPCAGCPVLAQH